jgi:hypothetical protein
MLALPPSGRRVPPPPRTLLLGPRSYRLIRQSRVALLYFGLLASFVESSQVATSPCCQRDLPDVILRIFPRMPGPMSRRSHRVHLPVSSSVSSAFPWAAENWLPASIRETTFPRELFRDCRHFFMLPGRTMARIGLRMMPPFPWSPLKSRTVSFPQYGFKAGMSDGAFPSSASSSRRPVCVRPSCPPLAASLPPFCVGGRIALVHFRASGCCRSTPGALTPVQVIVSWSINA